MYNFVKIRTVGAELFHADGQTGGSTNESSRHDGASSRFSQFYEHA
jgi:hypothetical protein